MTVSVGSVLTEAISGLAVAVGVSVVATVVVMVSLTVTGVLLAVSASVSVLVITAVSAAEAVSESVVVAVTGVVAVGTGFCPAPSAVGVTGIISGWQAASVSVANIAVNKKSLSLHIKYLWGFAKGVRSTRAERVTD